MTATQSLPKYLHLLLLTLLLEVLGVFTSSHSLKFRSNTHRKGSLLINNKLLNTPPYIYSVDTTISFFRPFFDDPLSSLYKLKSKLNQALAAPVLS